MTGKERRGINPNKGLIKLLERNMDIFVSRFLHPHLSGVWNPYSWLLGKRFGLAEASVSPTDWPQNIDPIRVLLISDIHTGIFLKPQTLTDVVLALMELGPDLIAIGGDMVSGHSSEVCPYLDALAPLSRAPLGAWYCYGDHDYFDGCYAIPIDSNRSSHKACRCASSRRARLVAGPERRKYDPGRC